MLGRILNLMKKSQSEVSEMSNQMRFSKIAQERQMTPAERELNRFNEEKRQKLIKAKVKMLHAQRQQELQSDMGVIRARNMFASQTNQLLQTPSLLRTNNNLFYNQR